MTPHMTQQIARRTAQLVTTSVSTFLPRWWTLPSPLVDASQRASFKVRCGPIRHFGGFGALLSTGGHRPYHMSKAELHSPANESRAAPFRRKRVTLHVEWRIALTALPVRRENCRQWHWTRGRLVGRQVAHRCVLLCFLASFVRHAPYSQLRRPPVATYLVSHRSVQSRTKALSRSKMST